MNSLHKPLLFLLIPLITGFSFEPDDRDMTAYRPVLLEKDDLPRSISMDQPRDFTLPGKIYIYNDLVFIVDLFTGIHVIDNQDPTQPQKTGFIKIPGVMDMAMRNQVLYADNSIDLISVDFSNYPQITSLDRVPDVFPEPVPPDMEWIPYAWSQGNRPENTVIVGWIK